MKLLILIVLVHLSLGSSVSLTKDWITSPKNISSYFQESAEAVYLMFDVNYHPVILNVNYSTSNASTTAPGMTVSTYSINQETLKNHTLEPLTGENNATYFVNFASHYTMSPTGSMISIQILPDSNGIDQIFYQYNDLQVDENTKSGFKSFISDLTNFVEQLVQAVTLVGTEYIDAFIDYTINIDKIADNLHDCAGGLSGVKDKFKDVHTHVKANNAGSAVKSLMGTSSSLISLFLTCTNQSITIPDQFQNLTTCGKSLIDIASTIAGFSAAPEVFIGEAAKLFSMLQSIPSTMSVCTGAFSLNSTTRNIPSSGSGYLTQNTVNTDIVFYETYRTSNYVVIHIIEDSSTIKLIAVQFDTNASKSFNLTTNLDSSQLSICASGGEIGSNSMFCAWVEPPTTGSSPVIMGAVIDLVSGSVASPAKIWVQSNSSAFAYIKAFVTAESYGIVYGYKDNGQLYAISNQNTSCSLGSPFASDRNPLLLTTINDSYIYLFWGSATTGPTTVNYEQYDGNCSLVVAAKEIISYDQSEQGTNFMFLQNGAGVYGLILADSSYQLGLIISSPIGLVSCFILLFSVITSLVLV